MFAKFTTTATSESAIEVGSSQIGTIVSGEYIEDQIYLTIAFPISGLYVVPDYEVIQFDRVKFNSSTSSNIALAVGTEEVGELMHIGATYTDSTNTAYIQTAVCLFYIYGAEVTAEFSDFEIVEATELFAVARPVLEEEAVSEEVISTDTQE